MRSRLIAAGYLNRNVTGHLKTTNSYFVLAVENSGRGTNLVRRATNSVPLVGELSSYKNNNRTTENSSQTAKEVLEHRYRPRRTVLPKYVLDERSRATSNESGVNV